MAQAREKTEMVVIHCSATKPSMDIGADTIRKWHVEGNGWSDIGYHKVIKRNGAVENGRPLMAMGAHVKGKNAISIGICMVGGSDVDGKAEDNFTEAQWGSLRVVCSEMRRIFPGVTFHGHNEFANKACPSFDVQSWATKELF